VPATYTLSDHVATLTIGGRNEYNTVTPDTAVQRDEALAAFDADPEARVLIIRGAGDRHFGAGGDLKRHHHLAETLFSVEGATSRYWYPKAEDPPFVLTALPEYIYRPVKPVIAAIVGYCLGGGLILVGRSTDIRIAGESAVFGLTEIRYGLGGPAAVMSRLDRQIPYTTLMWLVAAGQHIDAREALRVGLVDEVLPDEQVFARAEELAREIAELSPLAVRAEKQALRVTEDASFADAAVYARALETISALEMNGSEP
jgi:enoyl-CoA hydratase